MKIIENDIHGARQALIELPDAIDPWFTACPVTRDGESRHAGVLEPTPVKVYRRLVCRLRPAIDPNGIEMDRGLGWLADVTFKAKRILYGRITSSWRRPVAREKPAVQSVAALEFFPHPSFVERSEIDVRPEHVPQSFASGGRG